MTDVSPATSERATSRFVRRLLSVVLLLALLGTAGELLLVNHMEGTWQWLPLVLIAASLAAMGVHCCGGGKFGERLFRGLMIGCMASGLVGIFLHYQGKVEFKLEGDPSLAGMELFWAAIHGPAPPVLAPGVMIQIGLIGLAWSYCKRAVVLEPVDSTYKGAGQ